MRLFPSCTFKLKQLHKERTPCSSNSPRHRKALGIQSAMPSQLSMRKRAESLIWTIIGGGAATRMIFVMTNTIFVATKHIFSRNKSMLAKTKLLLRQTGLSRQRFCHDKHTLVATERCVLLWQTCVCRNKSELVMTKLLSRQAYFCHDRTHLMSWQNFCCNKNDSCGSSRQWYLTAYQPTTPSPQKERQTNTCTHTITL